MTDESGDDYCKSFVEIMSLCNFIMEEGAKRCCEGMVL